ncbi:MAG: amidohydrolase [Sphingobacteriales bacterium 17-39-43]|uniref:amidohydrolase family protein n=1 Tax=Daejeonella sp. TaxID=2805397 RepID=UPI000BCD913D|nr:amidohydrolase family protein [Daejeonella sp.]OYZ32827.1 MAG: amidohydrolase [Sphingobacteriales bacterium 16-39-50]OZA26237.1 MAG: amidohydrolase [Sphingobacteriales bacterium 17-39-43]HQT23181.1 amidohydrolase family protein [Daejeonella sp.]HQT56092.1 amidohydrolase family protein [Daejeonella sp.]
MMRALILTFLALLASQLSAQQNPKWNVEKPTGPSKSLNFQTNEGTWMNLDLSPDGQVIVFDLLGDIYKMPVTGGKATLLAGGMASEVQPRFSPNGKYISYTSDKDGGDNIWIMNADGSGKRAITKETFRLLNNAVWTPDSEYLIARKHFTSGRSLGAGEMWMYHIAGGGEGVQLTKRKNDQQDAGEPEISPDGKYVYFSEDVSPGPLFQYNKDPNGEIYNIRRLNRETGIIETVAGGSGGAMRPQISPDGKFLAFVRRVRLNTELFIQDLQTGEEWSVYDDLTHDQQEAWAIFGLYPNFAWTPDSREIIFYAEGKIIKLEVLTQYLSEIPFEVSVNQTITDALHYEQKVFNEEFLVKMIRQLSTSPDGKKIAFNAAGFIYLKDLPNGKPARISTGNEFEFEPEFSPDGKSLVYVSWSDDNRGSIMKYSLADSSFVRLSTEKGYYYSPKFSNQGDKIVYRKGVGNDVLGYAFGKNPGIYIMPANGGTPSLVLNNGIRPGFNSNDSRIFFQSSEAGKKALKSMDLNGGSIRTHYTSTYANAFSPSPDGKWIAFTELFNVYITPFANTGMALDLSSNNKSLPLTKVSKDAGTYIHWSKDSQRLNWTLGPKYFSKDIKSSFNFLTGAEKTAKSDSLGLDIDLRLKSDLPEGKIAITNARIITMKGDEVIENGTIVIDKNKITAIGTNVSLPEGVKVINASGKTIMPGIIDVHSHLRASSDGVSPQQDWSYYANLAFGVTTSHDPSANTEMVFSQADMVRSGAMVGPRVYSTGTILYGADGDFKTVVNSLDDARSALRRMKAVGAFSVKSYNQPRRDQRQQIIQAARELQLEVVPEGGSTFFHNLTHIQDGHTSLEHNIPQVPLFKDVKALWNKSTTSYTPTLIVSYGSQSGENYWYDRTNVWENERLLSYTPRYIVDSRSRRRTTSEFADYGHIKVARAAKELSDGGTKINLGAHGQLQGLGAHWELWMFAQGGMSSLQAIRSATLNGAEHLGMAKEIGSLETGKLADMLILDANPLDDIRNTEKIKYVIINGRVYDTETMNETISREKARNLFWWQMSRSESFSIPTGDVETYTFTHPECD